MSVPRARLERTTYCLGGTFPTSPDIAQCRLTGSGRGENRWTSPDVALCRWTLAPRLAPSDIVSNANARIVSAVVSPVHDPTDNFVQSGRAARAPRHGFHWKGFQDGSVTAGGTSRNPDQIGWRRSRRRPQRPRPGAPRSALPGSFNTPRQCPVMPKVVRCPIYGHAR